MSHTVAIKTELNNWTMLEKTLNQLGWVLKQKSKGRTYPSDPDRNKIYDWLAVNPQDGYDVGISLDAEGNVSLHYDPFGGSVERTLGKGLSSLKRDYVLNVTRDHYDEVEIMEQLADGSMIIEADDGM